MTKQLTCAPRRAANAAAPERIEALGPSALHAPAPLLLWRDIHLALADEGEAIRPEEMPAFALVRRDGSGVMRAALAGEIVLEALHVSHLWVDAAYRGQGLGRALMAQAQARGIAAGARRCHLETRSEPARAFYEKIGFRICGEMKCYVGAQSLYFMEKTFIKPTV